MIPWPTWTTEEWENKLRAAKPTRRAPVSGPVAKYSPDQARDEFGRWTDEGGGTGGGEDAATDSPEYRAGLASAEETRLLNESAKGIAEIEKHLKEVSGQANPNPGSDDEEEEPDPEWDNVDDDDQDKVEDKFISDAQESSTYRDEAYNQVDVGDFIDEDELHDDELKRFLKDASDALGVEVVLRPPEEQPTQLGDPDYDGFHNTVLAEADEYDWREAFEKGDYSALYTKNGTQVIDDTPEGQGLLIMEPDPNAPIAEQFMPARIHGDDLGSMWEDAKDKALERAREQAHDSDSYMEAVEEAETKLIFEAWNDLSDSEKLNLASEMSIYPSGVSEQRLREPDEWKWTDDKEDRDYERTRAIVDVLEDRRTAEILEARGLHRSEGSLLKARMIKETVWDEWKSSSTSNIGMALQIAIAEELGGVHRFSASEVANAKSAAKTTFGGASGDGYERLKAYARAQWETTQFVMSKAGVDHVEVYRGLMLPGELVSNASKETLTINSGGSHGEYEKLKDVSLLRNGAQSTTVDAKVANDWGGVGKLPPDAKRVVLRIRAPRTSVISIPVFGKNLKKEQEVVLAGTQGQWTWDAWVGRAPQASYVPIKAVRPMARPGQVIIDFGELDRGPHWMSGLRGENGAVAKYSPDQPRVPAGQPGGGQFTDGGGGTAAATPPATQTGWSLASVTRPPVNFTATTPEAFVAARDKSKRSPFLTQSSAEDLKGSKLYLSEDGRVGGALAPDGADMGNLFNNGGPKGAGAEVLLKLMNDGGRTADCFDGYLPTLYANFGLVETGRMKFNRDYAPAGWDYERDGEPDVVFLARARDVGNDDAIRSKVYGDKAQWTKQIRSTKYYDDYDLAKRDSLEIADAYRRRAEAAGRGSAKPWAGVRETAR